MSLSSVLLILGWIHLKPWRTCMDAVSVLCGISNYHACIHHVHIPWPDCWTDCSETLRQFYPPRVSQTSLPHAPTSQNSDHRLGKRGVARLQPVRLFMGRVRFITHLEYATPNSVSKGNYSLCYWMLWEGPIFVGGLSKLLLKKFLLYSNMVAFF